MGERQLLSDDKYIYMWIAALSFKGFTVRFLTIFLFAALKRRWFKGFLVYLRYTCPQGFVIRAEGLCGFQIRSYITRGLQIPVNTNTDKLHFYINYNVR